MCIGNVGMHVCVCLCVHFTGEKSYMDRRASRPLPSDGGPVHCHFNGLNMLNPTPVL